MTLNVRNLCSYVVMSLLFPLVSLAAEAPKSISNPDFARLKKLVGKWEGTHKSPKGDEKVPLTYELTSGGTVVVEKLYAGAPNEMTTVYLVDGDKIAVTHYCMLGNQPRYQLNKSSKDSLDFGFAGATNLVSANDPHMHALKLTMKGDQELIQDWTFYEGGKPKNTERFDFKRTQ